MHNIYVQHYRGKYYVGTLLTLPTHQHKSFHFKIRPSNLGTFQKANPTKAGGEYS